MFIRNGRLQTTRMPPSLWNNYARCSPAASRELETNSHQFLWPKIHLHWVWARPKQSMVPVKNQGNISRQDQPIQNGAAYVYQRGVEQPTDCIFCLNKIKTRSLLMCCCLWYTPTEQLQQLGTVPLETRSTSSPLMHPGNDPINEEFKTGRKRWLVCRLQPKPQSLWGQFWDLQNKGNIVEIPSALWKHSHLI